MRIFIISQQVFFRGASLFVKQTRFLRGTSDCSNTVDGLNRSVTVDGQNRKLKQSSNQTRCDVAKIHWKVYRRWCTKQTISRLRGYSCELCLRSYTCKYFRIYLTCTEDAQTTNSLRNWTASRLDKCMSTLPNARKYRGLARVCL